MFVQHLGSELKYVCCGICSNCQDYLILLSHCIGCNRSIQDSHSYSSLLFSDVGVKCRQPGWAGMRIPITAEQSIIEHAIFRQAGILDFDSQSVSSALQIDFNIRHRVKNCVFEENSNAGMVVLNNHLQPGNSVVEGARFRKNFGPALITHGPGLSIIDAEFIQNSGSGFLYDPKLTRYQQKELVSFLDRKNPWRTHIIPTTGSELFLNIDSNQEILLQSSARPHEANRSVAIQVVIKDMSYVLGIYALNPPSRGTTGENVLMVPTFCSVL